MRKFLLGGTILLMCVVISMCGKGRRPIVESTPRPPSGAAFQPVAPPPQPMEVPTPDSVWTPSAVGAEKGAMLTQTLIDKKNIGLILPKTHDVQELENRIIQMVKAAAPETKIVARGEAVLDNLLEERGEIPYRVTMEPSGSDVFGRPVYLPKEHFLNTEWLSKKKPLKGAEALLIVRPIQIDDVRLKEMRKARIGDCNDFEKALQQGLDDSVAYFAPYESEASAILGKEFGRQLSSAMPFWQSELSNAASTAAPGSAEQRCVEAFDAFLGKYKACLLGACPLSPRVFASAGGVLGMIDETGLIPDACPTPGMRDFAAEMRDLGDRSFLEVLPSVEGKWTGELARKGGLERIKDAMADACAPRHRRLMEGNLDSARKAVNDYLEGLKTEDLPAKWEQMRGQERIVGAGSVQVLARVKTTTGDLSAEVSAIAKQIRELDRCGQGNERLLQVSLIDTDTSQVLFMDIFFEEALLCEGFPPR